tara:strand:- start:14502 stop:15152 length:651 start_codon:yes stop_codon:yes gene_type:complete
MEKKNISISKKARYFQLGKISEQTKTIWFVFHGYGMLSQYFIKKFKSLENNQTVIISPEALSRFYIGENYDRVGASWITKEDKINDIDDNNNYLNSLFQSTTKNINLNSINVHVLGFSQGGATACRWILNSSIKINSLALWGADIPIDCLSENNRGKWNQFKTTLIVGKRDEFISDENKKEFTKILNAYNLDYELIEYNGTHKIIEEVLIDYIQTL